MTEQGDKTLTSWKQLRVRTSLGTLATVAAVLGAILYQGIQIQGQITSNSDAVDSLTDAVDELAYVTDLAMRAQQDLDERLDQLRQETFDDEMAKAEINASRHRELVDQLQGDLDWHQKNELRVANLEDSLDVIERRLGELEWDLRRNDL